MIKSNLQAFKPSSLRRNWWVAAIGSLMLAPSPATAQGASADGAWDPPQLASDERQRAADAKQRAEDAKQRAEDDKQREQDRKQRVDDQYQRAQELLEEAQWTQAVDRFQSIIDAKTTRTDAALYWKAYALNKLHQQADALAAVADLLKGYPSSRWLSDAKALEMKMKQNAGQAPRPEAEPDEELKLLAIQGLQHSDPEQAVPMLEKFLQGSQSPRLKQRALFVLSQSNSTRAREVLTAIARGGSNPDLQNRAIQYLGVNGTRENRQILAEIYAASTDIALKRQILRAFMVAGDRERVVAAATSEKTPELRVDAVRLLGAMGGHDELWALYGKETTVEVKQQILKAMFVSGDATRLIAVATSEANAELRRTAVRQLGTMSRAKTGDALVAVYTKDKDLEIRRQAVNGLFIQNNPEALVALARKETDAQMKKDIVSKLSLMQSKVALDYLMEILNK